jgi:molecular chaperone DnaK
MKEFGDKIPDEIKKPVETDIVDLKNAISENNTDKMKVLIEKLQANLQKIGEEIYRNTNPNPQSHGGDGGGNTQSPQDSGKQSHSSSTSDHSSKDTDVIDAEFDMVDDDKAK